MKVSVEMSPVQSCDATSCVYNLEKSCNARAITVGDGLRPDCDTFYAGSSHTRKHYRAGVGACKVSGCRFNEDYECQADRIIVGTMKDSAMCATYEARS